MALLVDFARVPVYAATQGAALAAMAGIIGIASLGAMLGTLLGKRVLGRLPERVFRMTVSLLILGLGIYMLAVGLRSL